MDVVTAHVFGGHAVVGGNWYVAYNAFSLTKSKLIVYIDGSTKSSAIFSALNEHISHLPYLNKDVVVQLIIMYIYHCSKYKLKKN